MAPTPATATDPSSPRLRVGMLSSWEERCGIADYSQGLVEALRPLADVAVVPASFRPSSRGVYRAMGNALNGPDVAHVQHSYAFFGGMRPRLAGLRDVLAGLRVPLVLTLHELDDRPTGAYHLPPAAERAYKRWFNRRSFLSPAVRAWVVHTAPLADSLIDLGAPPEHVHQFPMPVPEPPEVCVDARRARREFGVEGYRVLTIPGFLVRRKGYHVAIEALARLGPEYVLLCAGGEHAADGSGTTDWIRDSAASAGVGERVRITGYLAQERIPVVMAASDLILAPFTEMSGSASLHLAIGYRKAIVASDLPPNRGLGCVSLFPAGDAAALAAEAQRLMEQPAARRDLEARAAEYAHDRSYAALAARHMEIYERQLPARRAAVSCSASR